MMKKLLILLLLLSALTCNAQFNNKINMQYNNTKQVIIPTIVLASTATTVTILSRNDNIDIYTLDCVALSGVMISAMSYLIIEKIKDNPPKKLYKRRIKKLINL